MSRTRDAYTARRWLFIFSLFSAILLLGGLLFVIYWYGRPYFPLIVKWFFIAVGAAFGLSLLAGILFLFGYVVERYKKAHTPHIIESDGRVYVLGKDKQPREVRAIDAPSSPRVVESRLSKQVKPPQRLLGGPQKPVQASRSQLFTSKTFNALPNPGKKPVQAPQQFEDDDEGEGDAVRQQIHARGSIVLPAVANNSISLDVLPDVQERSLGALPRHYTTGMIQAPQNTSVEALDAVEEVPAEVAATSLIVSPKTPGKVVGTLPPVAPGLAEIELLDYIERGLAILGYNGSGPILGTIQDVYSISIIGIPGRGKSVFLRFLIAQFMMLHTKVWVFDPHATMTELKDLFVYEHNLDRMFELVPTIEHELAARLTRFEQNGGKCLDEPFLFVVDELPVIAAFEKKLAKRAKKDKDFDYASLMDLMENLVLQGRKFNMFLIIAGQGTPTTVLPSLTRDNIPSKFVFYTSKSQARMGGLEKEDIDELLPLLAYVKFGYCVARIMSQPYAQVVAVPLTEVADLKELKRRYPKYVRGMGEHQLLPPPGQSTKRDSRSESRSLSFPGVPFPGKQISNSMKFEHKPPIAELGSATSQERQGLASEAEGQQGMGATGRGRLEEASGAWGRQVPAAPEKAQQLESGRDLAGKPGGGSFEHYRDIPEYGRVPIHLLDEIERLARTGEFSRKEIVRALPDGYRSNTTYPVVKWVCDQKGLLTGNVNQYSPAVKQKQGGN